MKLLKKIIIIMNNNRLKKKIKFTVNSIEKKTRIRIKINN